MRNILLFTILCLTSLLIHAQQEKLELEGAIIIANSEDPIPAPGTIRFNPSTNDFEGWNGLYWASLTGNQYEVGEMTDQEGNTYPTVIIGNQEWMAKNLRTTTYRNGNAITLIGNDAIGDTAWSTANYGAYCVYDTLGSGYASFDINEFGHLYNWYAVADSRHLCPTDWHVPSGDDINSEWRTLINFLGGIAVAGGKMKEPGLAHWTTPNAGATNESGFSGLPGGYRTTSGTFVNIGSLGYWWSSTESGSNAWCRLLYYSDGSAGQVNNLKKYGFSVRCVRD